jgi:hypothetical protein
MDYYENVVVHYLRADRALFVNTECCIQLNQSKNPDSSGRHWYCDAVACDFRKSRIFLCEISYGAQLSDLTKRLKEWYANWDSLRQRFGPRGLASSAMAVRAGDAGATLGEAVGGDKR